MNCLGCSDVLVDGRCPRCEPQAPNAMPAPGELVLDLAPAAPPGRDPELPPGDLELRAAPVPIALELDVVRPAHRPVSLRPSARPLSRVVGDRLAARETDEHEETIDPRVRGQFGMTVPYDSRVLNTWSLPVIFALAALPVLVGEGPLVHMTVGMWTHELGHATAAWLTGIFAVPLPFVTVWPSEDRSVLVILVVALIWMAMVLWGLRQRAYGMVAAGAVVLGLQVWLTFVASLGRALQWVTWAGMGGEILLSAVVVAAFYQRLPYRWDFLRFPVVATAAVSLVHALHLWTVVTFLDASRMPRGAAVGDSSEGDLEKLVRTHEFTERSLAVTNLTLAVACVAGLVALYVVNVARARRP